MPYPAFNVPPITGGDVITQLTLSVVLQDRAESPFVGLPTNCCAQAYNTTTFSNACDQTVECGPFRLDQQGLCNLV